MIAENYIKRINAIQASACFADLEKLPQLNFHLLHHDREGQFAINLTGRARLIVTKHVLDGTETIGIEEVDPEHYGD